MKASNPKVMIEAYRLLVARLAAEGPDWNYPIHLGVTEAGDGEDGRIKSAIGIGSLLSDGIGDTIRISLTEDSVHEIPVARALVSVAAGNRGTSLLSENFAETRYEYDPFSYQRRPSHTIDVNGLKLGGEEVVRVVVRQTTYDKLAHKLDRLGDYQPEIIYEKAGLREVDPRNDDEIKALNCETCDLLVPSEIDLDLPVIAAFRMLAARLEPRHSILLKDTPLAPTASDFLTILLTAATNIGALLSDGIGDAILVQGDMMSEGNRNTLPGPANRYGSPTTSFQAAGQDLQDRLRRLPKLRTDPLRFADYHGSHQGGHLASQRREDRHHGLYREWTRRNGRRGFRICGRRARQGQPLRREDSREV